MLDCTNSCSNGDPSCYVLQLHASTAQSAIEMLTMQSELEALHKQVCVAGVLLGA